MAPKIVKQKHTKRMASSSKAASSPADHRYTRSADPKAKLRPTKAGKPSLSGDNSESDPEY